MSDQQANGASMETGPHGTGAGRPDWIKQHLKDSVPDFTPHRITRAGLMGLLTAEGPAKVRYGKEHCTLLSVERDGAGGQAFNLYLQAPGGRVLSVHCVLSE